MVLPVIVMLAALMLYLGRASVVSVGCQDAAANAARALMVQGAVRARRPWLRRLLAMALA